MLGFQAFTAVVSVQTLMGELSHAVQKKKKKEKKSELGVWRDKWVQEKGKLSNIISDIQGTRK